MSLVAPVFVGAVCAETDPEAFFPEKGGTTREAKAVCKGDKRRPPCPAINDCLRWALDNNEAGVWGGTSEFERRRLTGGIKVTKSHHGTEYGYKVHRSRNEKACGECQEAMRESSRVRARAKRSS